MYARAAGSDLGDVALVLFYSVRKKRPIRRMTAEPIIVSNEFATGFERVPTGSNSYIPVSQCLQLTAYRRVPPRLLLIRRDERAQPVGAWCKRARA